MRIYVASKSRHALWWQALRAADVPIVASWIDWAANHGGAEPSPDDWSRHWQRCVREAGEADVILFVALEGERQCGALIEIGAALSAGKRARFPCQRLRMEHCPPSSLSDLPLDCRGGGSDHGRSFGTKASGGEMKSIWALFGAIVAGNEVSRK